MRVVVWLVVVRRPDLVCPGVDNRKDEEKPKQSEIHFIHRTAAANVGPHFFEPATARNIIVARILYLRMHVFA